MLEVGALSALRKWPPWFLVNLGVGHSMGAGINNVCYNGFTCRVAKNERLRSSPKKKENELVDHSINTSRVCSLTAEQMPS